MYSTTMSCGGSTAWEQRRRQTIGFPLPVRNTHRNVKRPAYPAEMCVRLPPYLPARRRHYRQLLYVSFSFKWSFTGAL